MSGKTLYAKIWDAHVVQSYDDGDDLLRIDRHLVQEVSSPQAFATLDAMNLKVRVPDAHLAVADHAVPTRRRDLPFEDPLARRQVARLEENCARHGIRYIPLNARQHGIVHVVGPELGFTLPGLTLVCGDSHTSTHGAFGCIAFGIGASECAQVFATQCLRQRRQKTFRVVLDGELGAGVTIKDVVLALIYRVGAGGATGYALEFAGSVVQGLSMDARMTLCNMAIEAGSRVALIAPDTTTLEYLEQRMLAPRDTALEQARAEWELLPSDKNAIFDREERMNAHDIAPQVSWGTSPEHTVPITGRVPNPDNEPDPTSRERQRKSLDYMRLSPGTLMTDIRIDRVFIGSCTNSRLEDLKAAATVVKGRKVSSNITSAIVVPGSAEVRREAEAEGLHEVFLNAGFEWRQAGCSMCVGMNDDRLNIGERCASTSNRNFEGRQGAGGLTHLLSPPMAAAAAVTGRLADVRTLI